jgi:selenocysteine lyase/cysteine desulfurase
MSENRAFPIREHLDFFNHAGVAPLSGAAAEALRGYADQAVTRAYLDAGWHQTLGGVRADAARLIGAEGPEEIAFVPNTSTGLALVARGLDWRAGDRVVTTTVEYPANRHPWEDLQRLGVELVTVPPRAQGRIEPEDVKEAITPRTRLVSLSHVQFASGHRIDPRPVADAVHAVGGQLCLDGIQSVGAMAVDVQALGADFLAADGHKWMLGPEGFGFFYARRELIEQLHPAVVGWMNMEEAMDFDHYRFALRRDARRFEPGSHNVAGGLACGASIAMLLEHGLDRVWADVEAITARLCHGLERKGHTIYSPRGEGERSGLVVFEPPAGAASPKKIVGELPRRNILIVVRGGRLRASPHFYNTAEQVDRLVAALP